jgi:hypothetical protein
MGVSAFHWHGWISRQGWNNILSFIRTSVFSLVFFHKLDFRKHENGWRYNFHPYRRKPEREPMKLYFIIHVGCQFSVPRFPFAELGKEKTDDVTSSIHVDQRRETDEGMSIKKRWNYSLSSLWMSVFSPLFSMTSIRKQENGWRYVFHPCIRKREMKVYFIIYVDVSI